MAAGALVPEGMEVAPDTLVMGAPAKPRRAGDAPKRRSASRRAWQATSERGEQSQGRSAMIRAVKGTRDILPPASAAWNHVEAVAREVFRTYNYQEIRTPIFEETALFARGVGEDTDIVGKEMYTFEDRDGSSLTLRPEATASVMRAYIEHRLDQIPGRQEVLLHRSDVPPRASAEGPLPPVLSDRRGSHRIGIADRRRRSDRDGGGDLLRRAGHRRLSPDAQFGGLLELPPGVSRDLLREKLADDRAEAVQRLPAPRGHESAARAGLQGSRRPALSSTRCRRSSIIWTRRAASTSRACASIWMRAESRTKCVLAWCAAWITTCARRSKSRTGRWERRTRCWAAAATTAWRNPSARRFPRRASDSRSAKIAW